MLQQMSGTVSLTNLKLLGYDEVDSFIVEHSSRQLEAFKVTVPHRNVSEGNNPRTLEMKFMIDANVSSLNSNGVRDQMVLYDTPQGLSIGDCWRVTTYTTMTNIYIFVRGGNINGFTIPEALRTKGVYHHLFVTFDSQVVTVWYDNIKLGTQDSVTWYSGTITGSSNTSPRFAGADALLTHAIRTAPSSYFMLGHCNFVASNDRDLVGKIKDVYLYDHVIDLQEQPYDGIATDGSVIHIDNSNYWSDMAADIELYERSANYENYTHQEIQVVEGAGSRSISFDMKYDLNDMSSMCSM